jgi:hypothetical protein
MFANLRVHSGSIHALGNPPACCSTTALWSPTLRARLRSNAVGHVAHQFNPKARRVVDVP